MAIVIALPDDRQMAKAVFVAPLVAVGDHVQATVPQGASGLFLARPLAMQPGEATYVIVYNSNAQTNIRFRYDDGQATPNLGFVIDAGEQATIPCCGRGVSVASEGAAVVIEYQWFR